jgi:hypothetical protein
VIARSHKLSRYLGADCATLEICEASMDGRRPISDDVGARPSRPHPAAGSTDELLSMESRYAMMNAAPAKMVGQKKQIE